MNRSSSVFQQHWHFREQYGALNFQRKKYIATRINNTCRKWAYILLRNIICEEVLLQAVQPGTNYCPCLCLITPNLCSPAIYMEKLEVRERQIDVIDEWHAGIATGTTSDSVYTVASFSSFRSTARWNSLCFGDCSNCPIDSRYLFNL